MGCIKYLIYKKRTRNLLQLNNSTGHKSIVVGQGSNKNVSVGYKDCTMLNMNYPKQTHFNSCVKESKTQIRDEFHQSKTA